MKTPQLKIGDKVWFVDTHVDGSTITFSARIVKLENESQSWVEMPERVRRLPFPPLGGKRFGLFPNEILVKWSTKPGV